MQAVPQVTCHPTPAIGPLRAKGALETRQGQGVASEPRLGEEKAIDTCTCILL